MEDLQQQVQHLTDGKGYGRWLAQREQQILDAHNELAVDNRRIKLNKERGAGFRELERNKEDIARQREMQSLVRGETNARVQQIDWERELRCEQEQRIGCFCGKTWVRFKDGRGWYCDEPRVPISWAKAVCATVAQRADHWEEAIGGLMQVNARVDNTRAVMEEMDTEIGERRLQLDELQLKW